MGKRHPLIQAVCGQLPASTVPGALTQAQCQRRGHKPDLSTVHDPATSTLSHFCLFVELLKSIVNIVCGDLGKQRKVMGFPWWLSW